MDTVVLTIHLVLAFGLIIVVLLQRSEGGGLGIGGGGGGVVSGRGAATALSKLTWALGAGFVCTSLALTVLSAREAGVTSVIDRLDGGIAAPPPVDGGQSPGLGGNLLPPPPAETTTGPAQTEGPALPPPSD